MAAIPFTKMCGSGNDFILVDNRRGRIDEADLAALVTGVCRRRLSVGGDGVILIEPSTVADFRWRFRRERPLALAGGHVRVSTVNTGVPHAVLVVPDVDDVDVVALGREIRRHPEFAPAGTNADFLSTDRAGGLAIRTYERGVEDETLACGTGAVAGALVAAETLGAASPVRVRTRSGEHLTVHFRRCGGRFCNIAQEGGARLIFTGTLSEEAWR